MMPDWVLKHKKPGTTIKKIGNNYYLYYATSSRLPDKKYPVSAQSYIGKITEQGIISDKVSITVKDTEALPIIDITCYQYIPGIQLYIIDTFRRETNGTNVKN